MHQKVSILLWSTVFAVAAQASESCPRVAGLESLACAESAAGWAYADSPGMAATLAADAETAAIEFERRFGLDAPRGAVVAVGSGGIVPVTQVDALRGHGAKWILPWLSAEDQQAFRERTIRDAIKARLGADDGDPRVEALVARAKAQVQAQAPTHGSDENTTARSALRHEIGHVLLIKGFWPDEAPDSGRAVHYGGPAPDWLDEVAAVLMEDAAMTADRRKLLLELRDGRRSGAGLKTLAGYFAADHPLKAIAAELGARPRDGGASVRVIRGAEARQLGGQAAWFYAQARGVADFLLASSDDEGVFGDLARAFAAGDTMETWLAREGKDHGLPASLPELETRWQAWLAAQ
jgi:hypothetical protein